MLGGEREKLWVGREIETDRIIFYSNINFFTDSNSEMSGWILWHVGLNPTLSLEIWNHDIMRLILNKGSDGRHFRPPGKTELKMLRKVIFWWQIQQLFAQKIKYSGKHTQKAATVLYESALDAYLGSLNYYLYKSILELNMSLVNWPVNFFKFYYNFKFN